MAKIGLKETVLAMGFLGALVVPAIILGEKDRKEEEERKCTLEEKVSYDKYLKDNGLSEGETILWTYVPSWKEYRRVVFDIHGNPKGYNVYEDSERERASNSGNVRASELYQSTHGEGKLPYINTSKTMSVDFSKEDLETLTKVYKESKIKEDR